MHHLVRMTRIKNPNHAHTYSEWIADSVLSGLVADFVECVPHDGVPGNPRGPHGLAAAPLRGLLLAAEHGSPHGSQNGLQRLKLPGS
jgi:hypothetical protein